MLRGAAGPRVAVLAEVLFQRELRKEERHFAVAPVLEIVERVDACLAHDRPVVRARWNIGGGECQVGLGGKDRLKPLRRQLVAVTDKARERDFTRDSVLERTDAG